MLTTVRQVHHLNDDYFFLRVDNPDLTFKAGQFFSVGLPGSLVNREYSCASAPGLEYIDFLIRRVDGGVLSNLLARAARGDQVLLNGPYGEFFDVEPSFMSNPLFIATGTGIAPFLAKIRSEVSFKCNLLHGMRYKFYSLAELFNSCNHVEYRLFTSGESDTTVAGRYVTEALTPSYIEPYSSIFLCGNRKMISEAYSILSRLQFPTEKIYSEVFF